jgi:hypothetical protein
MQAVRTGEEIDRGHVGQVLIGDDQRDLGVRAGQYGSRRGRARDADLRSAS